MTQKIALAGTSSFSVTESTCLSLEGMVFRDEIADFTAVLYIYRKILVVETKDGLPGLFQAAWLPASCHNATAQVVIVSDKGNWSLGLTPGFS